MSGSHCPSCHALVRDDALWCPLCHLDLRPAPEPVSVAAVVPAPRAGQSAPLRTRHAEPAGWPCATCGEQNDLDSAVCEGCGSAFLAGLRSSTEAFRLPVVGDISKLSRNARVGIAVGVGLLIALLLSGLLALAGAVL